MRLRKKQAKARAKVCYGRSVGGADLIAVFGGGPGGRQFEARVAGVARGWQNRRIERGRWDSIQLL